MALGTVVAGGDDRREGLALGTAPVILGEQIPGHVGLAATHQAARHNGGQSLVGDGRGAAHDAYLVGILDDGADARDGRARRAAGRRGGGAGGGTGRS